MSAGRDVGNPNPPPGSSAPPSGYFPLPFHLQQQQPPPPMAQMASTYQYQQLQQAQQLFQRDAQTITPEALESVKAALATSDVLDPSNSRAAASSSSSDPAAKKKAVPRRAAGQSWEDPTLTDWPDNDYRLFCGDLGNEVNDDVLSKAFSRFPSFNMARVVRDKRTGKTKGYGFVSFSNPTDLAAAIKEMNGKYVGNRPIKLRKSNWKERTDVDALERQKNHIQKKPKIPKKSILHNLCWAVGLLKTAGEITLTAQVAAQGGHAYD
uniref:RRM domain-containing protein n=1 Tax=Leersia perrieri TaxID=77586 RepID=A0A0D9XB23_9ORYZ